MPIYLCQPGRGHTEPWRHGIQVYAHPFSMESEEAVPIRRVRHAEVVIVDDVCLAFDRYWLRLRWPGHRGGFAGYIAMGLASESTAQLKGKHKEHLEALEMANALSNIGSCICVSHAALQLRRI